MTYDQHANLAYSTVAVAPSPAASGTSLTVANGQGALFPTAPFNCTVYPPNSNPLASNAEIVRVTNVVGDVFTIVRAQEGTSARNIATGWQIANTATKLVFTDIENSIIQFISAGTTKASASEVVFSNSNNVSFGVSGQTVTASIPTATQSTQPVAASASNGSFLFSTLGFSDANGVSFGTSAGSIITASVPAGVAAGSLSAGTQSMQLGQVEFSNSNGITFGLSNSTVTASHNGLTSQSNQAASASNGSFAFQTLGFSDANGVTFGTSAGSIVTASVAAGVAAGSISAGTASVALGQVVFSNSNNITFGLDGSTVTASASQSNQQNTVFIGGNTLVSSSGTNNASSILFSAQGNVSAGMVGGSIILSGQELAASASNGSFTFHTLAFSNANNVTFGTSAGSIITASVNTAGGGGGSNLVFVSEIPGLFNNNSSLMASQSLSLNVWFDPFSAKNTLSFSQVKFLASLSQVNFATTTLSTGSMEFDVALAFYSRSVTDTAATNFSNSSIIVTHSSTTWALSGFLTYSSSSKTYQFSWSSDSAGGASSVSTSANSSVLNFPGFNGIIKMAVPFNMSLTPGDYWIARAFAFNAAGAGANVLRIPSFAVLTFNGGGALSEMGNVFGSSNFPIVPGLGVYSTAGTTMPASINVRDEILIGPFQFRHYHILQA